MNKKHVFAGMLTVSSLLISASTFAQNPILRSTTTGAPSLTGVTSSILTEKNGLVGVGTTDPGKRLTVRSFIGYGIALPGENPPPIVVPATVRLESEFTPNSGDWRYWDLTGSGGFSIANGNTGIIPMAISSTGAVNFMDKVSLNTTGGSGSDDNRLSFLVDNSRRRIFWTAYTSATNNTNIPLEFMFDGQGGSGVDVTALTLMPNGNAYVPTGRLGVGTTTPSEKLHVSSGNVLVSSGNVVVSNGTFTVSNGNNQFKVYSDGKVRAREVLVDLQPIPDYVFADTYPLMPISELKTFIAQNKHLPGIPSEAEYQERGSINLGELDMKLLEKVEELTQYIIQLEGRLQQLESQPNHLPSTPDNR